LDGQGTHDEEPTKPIKPKTIPLKGAIMKRLAAAALLISVVGMFSVEMALAELRKTLTPRISVQEQYDDNINLDPEGFEESDWITSVLPGMALSLEGPATTLKLDYEAAFSFYKQYSDQDTIGHRAQVAWDQGLSEHVSFHGSDRFVRSEDPILEYEGRIEDIQTVRRVYYRNSGEARIAYQFGLEDQLAFGYRNRYLDDRSSVDDDSLGHEGFANLDLWFGPRYGISLAPYYMKGDFNQDPDFDEYGGGITLNYRWKPEDRVYARYNLLYHDYENPGDQSPVDLDYRVHQGALGVSMALSPRADFSVEGGYYLQDYSDRDDTDGFLYEANLNLHGQRGSLRLTGSGGYYGDYYSFENLGSSEYRQGGIFVNHILLENLRVFAGGTYRWEDYTERDRTDKVWQARTGFSFSFWRWLTLSLEGQHSDRSSTDPDVEFTDNRVTFRLTGAYPWRL
jgi:hypothetical protein